MPKSGLEQTFKGRPPPSPRAHQGDAKVNRQQGKRAKAARSIGGGLERRHTLGWLRPAGLELAFFSSLCEKPLEPLDGHRQGCHTGRDMADRP